MAAEFAHDGADVRMTRAATAEFRGNAGREKPSGLEVGIVSCNKLAVLVVLRRAGCKGVTDITCNVCPIEGCVIHVDSFQFHDSLPK
jgi:hypothetical protein